MVVNDIGYVSWRNPHAVLDLWGLGSKDALDARKSEPDGQWMDRLATSQNVGIAMIYDSWFPQKPAHWILLGKLGLSGPVISLGQRNVSFYAVNPEAAEKATSGLADFLRGLPRGSNWNQH